jgi:hypothetical protein
MNHWKKPALVNGVVIVVLLLIDLATTAPNSNSYTPRFFLSGTLIPFIGTNKSGYWHGA